MIRNDRELEITQERVLRFQRLLARLRTNATPAEFSAVSGGYRLEIERMQAEALAYLTRHVSEVEPAEAA